jgi:stage III sporulation protein SpoIIIAA
LTAFDISEIIIEKGIKSREELLIFAKDQKDQGEKDIAEFIVNRGSKVVADILNTAWEMEHAKEKKALRATWRMQLLNEAREGSCVGGCEGLWVQLAKEILQNNGIILQSFQQAIIDLLTKGHGKYRNIMIIGPVNCGKTFILNPITKNIFNVFKSCIKYVCLG